MGFSLHRPRPVVWLRVAGRWYEQPDGTELLVDVLDANQQPVPGHTNLSLPAPLALDPLEHPSVHVRVRMSTNDTYVTPLVHSLSVGRTTYIGPQHIVNSSVGSNAAMDSDGALRVTGVHPAVDLHGRLSARRLSHHDRG